VLYEQQYKNELRVYVLAMVLFKVMEKHQKLSKANDLVGTSQKKN